MPPVQHHHGKDMPHLVTGAEVVQLSCAEEKGRVVRVLNSATTPAMQLAIGLFQSSTLHSTSWEAVKAL